MRAIAARAEVSPALVLHHYDSKEGLRRACDARLMEYAADKEGMLRTGQVPGLGDYLTEHPEALAALAYLRRVMSDGGAVAIKLFTRLHHETTRLLRSGEEAGTVRRSPDVEATAAVLTAWSLGALILQGSLGPALGAADLFAEPAARRYSEAGLDLLSRGILRFGASREGDE